MIKIHIALQIIINTTNTEQPKNIKTELSIIDSKPYEYIKNGISLFKLSNYNIIWGNLDWFNDYNMMIKIMDRENYHQDSHRILIKVEFPKEFQRLKFIILNTT
jgi:hypothetical protein